MTTVGLDEIADELYGLVPAEFVAARTDRAAAAKAAGDRALAAAVTKLPRPTVAAWLVNLLVRAEPEGTDMLLRLGPALRDAQTAGDGDELRRLSARRHTLLAALTRRAGDLATAAGQPVRDDATRALAETLEAALADPTATDAVRSGRLTRPLQYSGLGVVEVAGSVAIPLRAGRRPADPRPKQRGGPSEPDAAPPDASASDAAPRRTTTPEPAAATNTHDQRAEHERAEQARLEQRRAAERARQRQREQARDELTEADEALRTARRRSADREAAAVEARRALAGPRRRVDELTAQLDQARKAVAAAEAVAAEAERDLGAATLAASAADARHSAARAALERLENPAASDDG